MLPESASSDEESVLNGGRRATECPRLCLTTANYIYMLMGVCMAIAGIHEVSGNWKKLNVAGMPGGVNLIVTGLIILCVCLLGCSAVIHENPPVVIAYAAGLGLLLALDIIFISLHLFIEQDPDVKEEFEKFMLMEKPMTGRSPCRSLFQEVKSSVTCEFVCIVLNTVLLVYAYVYYRQVA